MGSAVAPFREEAGVLVVGGGVVGSAVAYGLARAGESVCLLDEGDVAFRASRGNFGLVWVQAKGWQKPDYGRWSLAASRAWPALAADLAATTGIDVELSQPGGVYLGLTEQEVETRAGMMADLRAAIGDDYRYDRLDALGLRAMLPDLGPDVVGGVYCPFDGHANPLRVLPALTKGFLHHGGRLVGSGPVRAIDYRDARFEVTAAGGRYRAARLVLAAGLGNKALAPMVGLQAPVRPQRGQILVTERQPRFLSLPTLVIRQTGEGVVQIGDSKEEVGLDDGTTTDQLSRIAHRAVRSFPRLGSLSVVRTWGALRVMSPDGFPIYGASRPCPGAFVVSCHSGITLAPLHASLIAEWIRGGDAPALISGFSPERFHV